MNVEERTGQGAVLSERQLALRLFDLLRLIFFLTIYTNTP